MTLTQQLVCALIRPYTWRELPGWGHLYRRCVGSYENDAFWRGARPRTIRGKLHGYKMTLSLELWSERTTFFLGRFYDLPTQELMCAFLRPGDRFCDIGANIGMLTLLAARLVDESGVVDAFEPNADCQERIRRFLEINNIDHVRVHGVGLAEVPGSLRLAIKSINSGEGTLAPVDGDASFDVEQTVDVVTGDSLITNDPRPPIMIKIDVEGYECKTLAGLRSALSKHHPVVSTEVVSSHLLRAGDSVDALFDLMEGHGYRGYELGLKRSGLRHALRLRACSDRRLHEQNVVWVPREGPAVPRAHATLPLD